MLGVRLVGARVTDLVAEAMLVYNWETLSNEVAQFIHATRPSRRRSARRT